MKHRPFTLLCMLLFVASLGGCGNELLKLKVYKIDIQQGNVLEAQAVEQVRLGMTKEQVHFLLGTPLIVDSFHPDRWDYLYMLKPGHAQSRRSQLTLIFDRNEVIEIIKHNIQTAETAPAEQDEAENEKDTDR